MERQVLVTLVHGTFARDAFWAKPNSAFAEELQSRVDCPIEFHSWQWSGENDFLGREKASSDFGKYLSAIAEDRDKETVHYIVAHSHGGNVVLDAVRNTSSGSGLEKLILLGTPFFQFKGRDNKEMYGVLKAVNTFGSLLASLILAGLLAALMSRLGAPPAAVGIAAFLTALALVTQLPRYAHRNFVNSIIRKSIRNKRKLNFLKQIPEGRDVFVSYVSFDEAYLLLRTLSLIKGSIVALFFFFMIGSVIWFIVMLGLEGALRQAFLYGTLGMAATLAIAEMVGLICDRVLIRHAKSFGTGSWIDAFSIDVEVSREPHDMMTNDTHAISFRRSLISVNRYIRHSIFYRDPIAIQRIARWINQSL